MQPMPEDSTMLGWIRAKVTVEIWECGWCRAFSIRKVTVTRFT
jgi:hypothetical protein